MRGPRGTLRDTEGVGHDMSMPLKLFLVSGSLFSETSAQITTSIYIFRGNTFFVGIQEVSARRVRKEQINYYLYLFA